MTPAPHPYLRFRTRMARHALRQFVASLHNSLGMIMLGFGQVLVGLLACIALPGLYAATQPWPAALALVAAQVLVAAAPAILLRKRLHPADAVLWSRSLPIPAPLRWRADAAVAGILVVPLGLAYAISTAIWFYQWPEWLRPVARQALLLTAVSVLLGWMLSTLALAWRARLPAVSASGKPVPAPQAYLPRTLRWPALTTLSLPTPSLPTWYLWRQLFWLPFWRADNVIGVQQTVLLLGALASVAVWLLHPSVLPPALWGASASLLLLVLSDRGDKAVAEQIARLQPVVAAWPVRAPRLFRGAIAASLLPGLCVMGVFAAATLAHPAPGISVTVARVWLAGAGIAQLAIVGLRRLDERGRVALVITSAIILTAIGSELWN